MIYLLHFDTPLAHAQHYLGTCREDRLDARLLEHARGTGAKIVAAAIRAGITVRLARTIPDVHHAVERDLKRRTAMKKLCPICCPVLAHLKSEGTVLDPRRVDGPPVRAVLDWRVIDPQRKG